MQDYKIEIQFNYEGGHYYHYVFDKRKDSTTAILNAIKVAQSHFSSCGWKKYEITHVGLVSSPDSPPKFKEYDPPTPPPAARVSRAKPKAAAKPARKTTSTRTRKPAAPKPPADKPKRTRSTGAGTKRSTKATPAKRTGTTNRKTKR